MKNVVKCKIGKIEVFTGEGALTHLASLLVEVNIKKPMIVIEKFFLELPVYSEFALKYESLGGEIHIFDGITPNPKDHEVMCGVEKYKATGCDAVIAIGGGSTMDAAKSIAFMVRHEGNVIDYARSTMVNRREFKNGRERLVCVPTTAGTGSEISPHSVITNTDIDKKCNVTHPSLYCDIIVLDPKVFLTLPPKVTAESGIDALCHAIEAYTNKVTVENFTPYHDAVALQAIRLIAGNLRKAYEHGNEDVKARESMAWAAFMAGIVLDLDVNCCHGLAGVLQTFYHNMSHGVSVGVLLPSVMEFNLDVCPERFKDIAVAMGENVDGLDDVEAGKKSIEAVKKLFYSVKFPRLKDFVCKEEDIDKFYKIGASSSCNANNPKLVTEESAKEIYVRSFKDNWE